MMMGVRCGGTTLLEISLKVGRGNGLCGRPSGGVQDLNYSDANKKSSNEETFKDTLRTQRQNFRYLKTRGIKNAQEITDLWAYLKKFDAEGLRNRGMHESDALAYQHRFECAPGASA
jgi:hypothetical protein